MTAYELGRELGMEKDAASNLGERALLSYLPGQHRRDFTPAEESAVRKAQRFNVLGSLIDTADEPLTNNMVNPLLHGMLAGGLPSAALGGVAGYAGSSLLDPENKMRNTAIGAGVGGLLGTLKSYITANKNNAMQEELMRRLPEGATQLDADRAESAMARLEALQGRPIR